MESQATQNRLETSFNGIRNYKHFDFRINYSLDTCRHAFSSAFADIKLNFDSNNHIFRERESNHEGMEVIESNSILFLFFRRHFPMKIYETSPFHFKLL